MKDYWKNNSGMIVFSAILFAIILIYAATTPASQNVGLPQYCDTEGC